MEEPIEQIVALPNLRSKLESENLKHSTERAVESTSPKRKGGALGGLLSPRQSLLML